MSRIDRCVCEGEWIQKFQSIYRSGVDLFAPQITDHVAITVKLSPKMNWGPKPFRSINAWFQNPSFKPFVRNEWKRLGQ